MKITQLISAPQSIGGPIDGGVLLYNMSDCVEWEEVVDFPEDFWDDAGRLAACSTWRSKSQFFWCHRQSSTPSKYSETRSFDAQAQLFWSFMADKEVQCYNAETKCSNFVTTADGIHWPQEMETRLVGVIAHWLVAPPGSFLGPPGTSWEYSRGAFWGPSWPGPDFIDFQSNYHWIITTLRLQLARPRFHWFSIKILLKNVDFWAPAGQAQIPLIFKQSIIEE